MAEFYRKEIREAFSELRSRETGLTQEEANARFAEFGPNKFFEKKPEHWSVTFLRQFQSPLIYLLLFASGIVFFLGEVTDGAIILAVLIFNAIVGSVQEGKTQHTLRALSHFVKTDAAVLREGKIYELPDEEVVPGDVVLLSEGEKVPADARVLFSKNLKIDESALTGESLPVRKTEEVIHKEKIPVADQRNMVFKGTVVVAGHGKVLVTTTGMHTEMGKISKELVTMDTEVPLKSKIRVISRVIIVFTVTLSSILFVTGVRWFGYTSLEMFKLVVALSVSFIPEGLPIALTLVLVRGVWRMAKRNALVKHLQAVEALGQAKIIAVDKTGTITKNQLLVEKVQVGGKLFEVSGEGYEPRGDFSFHQISLLPAESPELLFAGKAAAFGGMARVFYEESKKEWKVAGDPTEGALVVFGEKTGFKREEIEEHHPILEEIPFGYEEKYRVVVREHNGGKLLVMIGAPEAVLSFSNRWWMPDTSFALDEEKRKEFEHLVSRFSERGFRVLAFAVSEFQEGELLPTTIPPLIFGGLYAMRDTLRPEVHEAMERAKEAGTRVVMITGDHKLTAVAIAKEAGIYEKGDEVLTGAELDGVNDEVLARLVANVSVFARVGPQHKLRIIQAFRKRGEIIAMTGDGVNDAPSLVAADLGVAMGKIGTEVAKEAADIVLLDDNFGSIVSAIEEGRNIYRTIRKVLQYLFSTNLGEVFVISVALFLGYPSPLLPGQVIWLNFITDGFLVAALAMEPKEEGLLTASWKKLPRYFLDGVMIQRIFLMSLAMMVGTLFLFREYLEINPEKALTISLTTLAIFQWLNAWNCRSESKSVFKPHAPLNPYLIGAMCIVIVLQVTAIYIPWMQSVLHTTALSLRDWFLCMAIAASIIVLEEGRKLLFRRLRRETASVATS